jgi:hypothetical protein
MVERLTDEMRILATQRLTAFRKSLWKAADEIKFGNVPRAAFLPDYIIKAILDNFALLQTPRDLDPIIAGCIHLVDHRDALWSVLVALRPEFITLRAKADAEKEAEKRVKALAAPQGPG